VTFRLVILLSVVLWNQPSISNHLRNIRHQIMCKSPVLCTNRHCACAISRDITPPVQNLSTFEFPSQHCLFTIIFLLSFERGEDVCFKDMVKHSEMSDMQLLIWSWSKVPRLLMLRSSDYIVVYSPCPQAETFRTLHTGMY